MRFFKAIVPLGAVLSCLGGCLPSAGPTPGQVSDFSTPPAQETTVKAGPTVAAEEGIAPKPDTSSLGNERKTVWRVYYGEDASLLQNFGTLTIKLGGEPTALNLRLEKAEGDPQDWADAPVGQRLRLFLYDPGADLSPDPVTGDPLPQSYCDETVTALQGNPPENISANTLSLKPGSLLIFAYDSTKDFFDCAGGWVSADPAMTSGLLAMGSSFVGNITLKYSSLPVSSNRLGATPSTTPDPQPIARPSNSARTGLPFHLP